MITLWKALRPYLSPLVGALGTIFIACTLINIGVGNIVTSLLGDRWGTNIGLSLSGATVFLISALHIAGIYAIDDEINRST